MQTSPEVYDVLRQSGLAGCARVLDLGRGEASQPFAHAGATVVTADERLDGLMHPDASFDAALAADVFHAFEQQAAFAALLRVVRPGGLVAIWWPALASDGSVAALRLAAAADAGLEPIPDPLARGFRAFYGAPFAAHALRVVPAMIEATVGGWLAYERSRAEVARVYGERAEAWYEALELRLLQAHGNAQAALRVPLFQYCYLGTV